MSTITGTTINQGITLSIAGTYASPLTIANTGTITPGTGDAVVGSDLGLTLVNQGFLNATRGNGVTLSAGGYVNNTGTIGAQNYAIAIKGSAGTVFNTGYVGYVPNNPFYDRDIAGVYLTAGG